MSKILVETKKPTNLKPDSWYNEFYGDWIGEFYSGLPSLEECIQFQKDYDKNIDNIVGYVNKMGLINIKKQQLFTILQEPLFIPEPKTIVSVLSEFKIRNIYIAIILDEYGGTSGLITLKDILDYIFIKDMLIKNLIHKKDKSIWSVNGDTKIFEVNMYFNIDLPIESNTISGYIVNRNGEIPKEGETLSLAPGIYAKILKSDEKQIDLLEINRVEK